MKLTRKILSFVLALSLLFSLAVPCFAVEFNESLWTNTFLVMDLTTGDVVASSRANEKMYPASLTKMMTAILAYEYYTEPGRSLNEKVYADEEAANVEPTKFGVKLSESMTADEAIKIMLLMSANDIAIVLAKEVGGTTENFARLMNIKAKEIGCENTNFVTPNGLHDDNHYSTASDLAKIACYLLDNEYLASVVALEEYHYVTPSKHNEGTVYTTNYLYNSTKNIYVGNTLTEAKYEGGKVFGVKTGTTPEAGGCLIAGVERNNTRFLAVILDSRSGYSYQMERYADAHKIFDWSFTNYRTYHAAALGDDTGIIKVKRGEFNKVETILSEDVYMTLSKEISDSDITSEIVLDEFIEAPFEEGTKVGTYTLYKNGEVFGTYDVITKEGVVKGGILSIFGIEDAQAHEIFKTAGIVLFVIFVLVVALLCVRAYNKRRYAKKRAERAKRRAQREAMQKQIEAQLAENEKKGLSSEVIDIELTKEKK